jgi:hypothetical protein
MKYKNILILFLLVSASCKEDNKLISPLMDRDLILTKQDSVYFHLDSISTGRNANSSLYRDNGKLFYTFLNKKNNSLYFYNIESPNITKVIPFELEGENGVGNISSFHISNMDSIFLYNYGRGQTFLADSNSKILRKYFVNPEINAVKPQVDNRRPLVKMGNQLIFNSWGSEKEYYKNSYFPETLFMSLDLKESTKKYIISYPDSYKEAVWGVQFFQAYHEFNEKDNKLIISFPIENDLFVYDFEGLTLNAISTNTKRKLKIEPLSSTADKFVPDITEEVKHQMGQSYYTVIKYDSVNDIYVRVINESFDEKFINEFSGIGSVYGAYSLVFLDNKFQTIGMVSLPSNSYYLGSMFFEGGMMYLEKIQNYDEDLLVFDVFNFSWMREKRK